MEKYLLGSEDRGSIEEPQVPTCIFKCRSLRGHGDGQQQKKTCKNQPPPPLQTKIDQKLFLLKNCCLCHDGEW